MYRIAVHKVRTAAMLKKEKVETILLHTAKVGYDHPHLGALPDPIGPPAHDRVPRLAEEHATWERRGLVEGGEALKGRVWPRP